jgi:hypothetical protein
MFSSQSFLASCGTVIGAVGIIAGLRHWVVGPAAMPPAGIHIANPVIRLDIGPSEVIEFTVHLVNTGNETILVTGCDTGCDCTVPQDLPIPLQPRSERALTFTVEAGGTAGAVTSQRIRLYTVPPIPNLVVRLDVHVDDTLPVSTNPR